LPTEIQIGPCPLDLSISVHALVSRLMSKFVLFLQLLCWQWARANSCCCTHHSLDSTAHPLWRWLIHLKAWCNEDIARGKLVVWSGCPRSHCCQKACVISVQIGRVNEWEVRRRSVKLEACQVATTRLTPRPIRPFGPSDAPSYLSRAGFL